MVIIKKKRLVLLIVCTVIASLVIGTGALFGIAKFTGIAVVKQQNYDKFKTVYEKYEKLDAIDKVINEQFLWDIDEESQMDAIYRAMIDNLGDKYSQYMSKEEYSSFVDYVTGKFTGIGVVFTTDKKGRYIVTQLIKDGPAETVGIEVGDEIIKVDGKTYDDSNTIAEAMRGESGTQVKITIKRNNKEKDFDIVRAEVESPSVYSEMLNKDIGYITIAAFEETTGQQFKDEVAKFEQQNVKGLVIDLRNNPGGLVDQGVIVADELLPDCTIAHTENKQGEKEYYNSDADCTKLKYVLLVNENTASASEIVAAAVKDNKGGKIVGTTTYGKGIIQGTVSCIDGSAVKLTIMQYFSPKGEAIHEIGVKPDYEVKLSSDSKTDKQLEKAMDLLK